MTLRFLRLGDVASFMGGGTPSRKRVENFGGGIPWVKTTDLNNKKVFSTEETLTPRGLADSSCKMIPAQAVLVAMYGGFNQIGRTGLLLRESAINQALTAIIPDRSRLLPEFLLEWLNFRVAYWRRFAGSSRKDPNITKGDVADFPVPVVPLALQELLASAACLWDAAIERTEKLIGAKGRRYSHQVSLLLIGSSHSRRHRVGEAAQEVLERNRCGNVERVLSVTNSRGFILPEEHFERRVASADLSNYKIVRRGQFAYNPSRINVGSIARLDDWDEGVLSPMYVVFRLDESRIESNYFMHWLQSHDAHHRIGACAQGSVRETVPFSEFARLPIPLPSTERQEAIARYLDSIRAEIELLSRSRVSLVAQKRGLMQKLLTGEWRPPHTFATGGKAVE